LTKWGEKISPREGDSFQPYFVVQLVCGPCKLVILKHLE
jgi:hypothetical protein